MPYLGLFLLLFILSGCQLIPRNSIASQPPSTCPEQSQGTLKKEQMKTITLTAQPLKQQGSVKAGQDSGYQFQAQAGYRLKHKLTDDVCIVFYTPDNRSLKSTEFSQLPTSGTYTAQLFIASGSATYDLELSLEDPQQVSIATTPMTSPATSSVSPSPSPKLSCTERADAVFYEKYPEMRGQIIDRNNYDLAKKWLAMRNDLADCPLAAPAIEGTWTGGYDNDSGEYVLTITDQKLNNTFKGTLITARKTKLALEGEINPQTLEVTIREVGVISEAVKGNWATGENIGKLSDSFRSMGGTGEDKRGMKYNWSFSR